MLVQELLTVALPQLEKNSFLSAITYTTTGAKMCIVLNTLLVYYRTNKLIFPQIGIYSLCAFAISCLKTAISMRNLHDCKKIG